VPFKGFCPVSSGLFVGKFYCFSVDIETVGIEDTAVSYDEFVVEVQFFGRNNQSVTK